MARSIATIAARIRANLDPAFHGWGAHLDGLAAAIQNAELLTDGQIPLSSIGGFGGESAYEGAYLDLIGRADGVERVAGESNASYRERIRAGALGSDIVSLQKAGIALLTKIDSGLLTTSAPIEHHDARFYCDDDATEHLHDFFLDGGCLLGATRGVSIVVWGTAPSTDVEDALLALLNSWRAAGIRCWLVVDEGSTAPVVGFPWATA